ncbi:MAG: molybdopterin-guanine dinucleotide biosynthesis protein B [Nitrospirota bacterium]
MKIVSFVAASSNSGKTTLIEKVVRILKERGLRVAVIKHASKGFAVDQPGKDSWRFREAGADAVMLVGPDEMALMKNISREPDLDDLAVMVQDIDVVLREGFKKDEGARIEVFRSGVSGDQPLCMNDRSFRALVSDVPFSVDIPRFDLNDAAAVADFIAAKL